MFRACAIFMMLLLIGGCLVAVYFIKRDLSIEVFIVAIFLFLLYFL